MVIKQTLHDLCNALQVAGPGSFAVHVVGAYQQQLLCCAFREGQFAWEIRQNAALIVRDLAEWGNSDSKTIITKMHEQAIEIFRQSLMRVESSE